MLACHYSEIITRKHIGTSWSTFSLFSWGITVCSMLWHSQVLQNNLQAIFQQLTYSKTQTRVRLPLLWDKLQKTCRYKLIHFFIVFTWNHCLLVQCFDKAKLCWMMCELSCRQPTYSKTQARAQTFACHYCEKIFIKHIDIRSWSTFSLFSCGIAVYLML